MKEYLDERIAELEKELCILKLEKEVEVLKREIQELRNKSSIYRQYVEVPCINQPIVINPWPQLDPAGTANPPAWFV
jgi:hypothetical protein